MSSQGDSKQFDLRKYLLSEERAKKIAQDFRNKMVPFLRKNRKKMFTLKGAPEIHGLSTRFGPYTGRNLALYLSKNPQKNELKKIGLSKFYLEIEKLLLNKVHDKIEWRSNLLINSIKGELVEIEIIPMAFKGVFLLDVLKRGEIPHMDTFQLVHSAVIAFGRLIHEAISKKGYLSTYPRVIKDIEKEDAQSFAKEIEKADFYVELRFIEKSAFVSKESELMEKFSESSLEKKIGLELIKEAIPFIIQYRIKADFPKQKAQRVIAKPDFIILTPLEPIAIFCDSRRYHERKKDQILKDRRIDRRLQKMGFAVFRFSEEEIDRNLEGCVEEIKEHYFGKEYSLSPHEVFIRKLENIDLRELSEWERIFAETLKIKLNRGRNISLKEERILHQILKKLRSEQ